MLEDRAGNLWVGVYDGLYLFKDGHFLRIPEPDHQPLGLVAGLVQDTQGDIWAECAGVGKLLRIRDFQVREEFSRAQVPTGRIARGPAGRNLDWHSRRATCAVSSRCSAKVPAKSGAKNPFSNQDRCPRQTASFLLRPMTGSWDSRTVQRSGWQKKTACPATKSFLPLRTRRNTGGFHEMRHSRVRRLRTSAMVDQPGRQYIQTRLSDSWTGHGHRATIFQCSRFIARRPRVVCEPGVVQMVDPSKLSEKAVPAETYIESVTVDRKELAGNQ